MRRCGRVSDVRVALSGIQLQKLRVPLVGCIVRQLHSVRQRSFGVVAYAGGCVGVEALLRWRHPILGVLYPPLKDNLFDPIKLDGSLIQGLFVHQNDLEIVSSIVQLADTLGLAVLAEFVETERQRDTLHELGCDLYQGYLYSPAVFMEE